MPLYRKRFKQPLSQQQPRTEITASPFAQSSSSQQAHQRIPKFHATMHSPVYPEVFPRSASEPNECAFADDEFGNGKSETEKAIPSPGYNARKLVEFEECDSQNLQEDKNGNITKDKNEIQEMAAVKNSHIDDLSKVNKDISSTDKLPRSDLVENSNIPHKTHINQDSKSQNKENVITKKKKRNTDKPKTRIRNKNKGAFESQSPNSSNTSYSKTSYSRDQNTSLNSSKSSQISMNESSMKEAYKQFLLEKKTVKNKEKINCTQNSDVSLNDPVVKETYSQFIEKKQKFPRMNTPKGLTHLEKMKWLQKERNVGVYVHCDGCNKIRYLEEINDPTLLPDKWYCEDNTDLQYNKCEIPQENFPLHIQADWIDNLYNAGSIVWARVEGYPWWPGMVDDDPNTESYYWLEDELNDTPSYYHVTFFDQKEVTRAWLKPFNIKSFNKEKNNPFMLPDKHSLFKERIDFALKQAYEALGMSLQKRLEKFSFLVRYKKPIKNPRNVPKEDLKRKAKKLNETDFVEEKRRNRGKRKTKNQSDMGQKLERNDSFPTDFEIPPSPVLENISLELFEDV